MVSGSVGDALNHLGKPLDGSGPGLTGVQLFLMPCISFWAMLAQSVSEYLS